MDEKLTPEQELEQARAQLQKPAQGLDSAAWLRLGDIAQATHSSLRSQSQSQSQAQPAKAQVAASVPGQSQGLLAALAAETWRTLQNGWHKFRHPIQHFRRWLADMMQPPGPAQAHGVIAADGKAPESTPTPPEKGPGRGPTLDQTWTAVRDQLFEAAKDPKVDPQKVADAIVAAIPAEHREPMAERLQWLSEMAQTTAKSLQPVERVDSNAHVGEKIPLGEAPPEREIEPPMPDNVRLFERKPPQRQVPKQPLPEQPKVPKRTKAETKEKAKVAQR